MQPEPVAPVSQPEPMWQPEPVAVQQPAPQAAPQAAPVHQGPPPGAKPIIGPPPGAKPPTARPAYESQPILDIPVDETAGQRSTFSPAFLALVGGTLVMGLVMGYIFASSSQLKRLYNAQTEAAKTSRERIKPSMEEAKKVIAQVKGLAKDTTKPNYEVAASLAESKFVPDPGAVNSMIGGSNSYNINQFMAKASVLKQMLKQHNYMTNTVDKAELEELVKNNDILQGSKQFAVIYNYKILLEHLKSGGDDKGFKPTEGRLVAIDKWEVDDKGEVSFKNLADNKEASFSVKGVIPLNVSEILKTGGQNALQRYKQRVETLAFYAEDLDKGMGGLVEGLDKLADRGEAPFIQLTASEPPAAPKPPADDAAPAAPAAPASDAAPAADGEAK